MNDRKIIMMPGSVYNEHVEQQNIFPGLQAVENHYTTEACGGGGACGTQEACGGTCEETEGKREPEGWEEEVCENLIFQPSLIRSRPDRLAALHGAIGRALDQLEGKGELFWIAAAVEDADVANFRFAAADFVRQMKMWFPGSPLLADEERSIAKGISAERARWIVEGRRMPLKDMAAKAKARILPRELNLKQDKVKRIVAVAHEGLYKELGRMRGEWGKG